jgi:hypothetical protein
MKFTSCAGWIKQVGHGAADNRADDTEHDCPHDREMRVHERLCDTTHEEPNKDIPNEMKHYFLLLPPDSAEINRSSIRSADQKLFKIFQWDTRALDQSPMAFEQTHERE